MTDVWGDDEETLGEMAERFGRRAVVAVAEAENARLRAQLEAVRDIHRPDPSALRWCEACEERIPCPTTAALSNEGGDDG